MYKKNRIKEMIDNGQIPLGMQCFFRIQDHVEF